MSEDERVIEIIGGSEMVLKSISLLRKKTNEDKEEDEEEGGGEEIDEEEGICVSEKNGLLGIVLEVVEGGGWKGSYSELEEVMGRLEEEGKKRWMEKRGEKGRGRGREWKEMGRLARDVGWAIEERKGMSEEGRGREGSMITLSGMKKNLEEEKKRADEEKKGREEEKRKVEEERKRADEEERKKEEEKRKREESERGREEEKRRADEEKKGREEDKRIAEEEKRKLEERIRSLERDVQQLSLPIKSLSQFNLSFSNSSLMTVRDNRIIHVGGSSQETCVFKEILEAVCIFIGYRYSLLHFLFSLPQGIHHLFVYTSPVCFLSYVVQHLQTIKNYRQLLFVLFYSSII